MLSKSEAIRLWLNDIQHHIAMAQGFIAGMSGERWRQPEIFTDMNMRT